MLKERVLITMRYSRMLWSTPLFVFYWHF